MSGITWVDEILGFGNVDACALTRREPWAVVHACKDPCHRAFVGYKGSLPKAHSCYLNAQEDDHLYLNLIDPPLPLFKAESFSIFFDFIDRHLGVKPVVIHCNRGESRAPSLTLLVMAKRLKNIPDDSYAAARAAFEEKFPYKPGGGISLFLRDNWGILGR